MATENFTLYNEVDEADDITKTSSRVTFDTMARNIDSWVNDDKGVGHFAGDFTHKYKFEITYISQYGQAVCWGMSNQDETLMKSRNDRDSVYDMFVSYGSPTIYLQWMYDADSNWATDSGVFAEDTVYYITVIYDADGGEFSAGQLLAHVCTGNYYGESDSSLVDTLSTDIFSGLTMPSMRYIYAMSSVSHATSAYTISGYVEDLDLGEEEGVSIPVFMNHYKQMAGN